MTLRARIVVALVLAALVPMAVVLAVPMVQAEKRAREETSRRLALARSQAEVFLGRERDGVRAAADRLVEALAADRSAQIAVVRGPESAARPVASAYAFRFGLDRLEIAGTAGTPLATFGAERDTHGGAALSERRPVAAESETLHVLAERTLGEPFAASVGAITGGDVRWGVPGSPAWPEPRVELPLGDAVLCVSVKRSDTREVRRDLVKSFAGVAPFAMLAALAVGLFLAGRIAQPVRRLAERAEAISEQHAGPLTLLEEKDEIRRMTLAFDRMLDSLEASERKRLDAERVAAWEEIAKRLAHEIKNPLSPIQLAVENLRKTREKAPESFDAAFEVETRTILEEVEALRALVDEFARFARLPRPQAAPCRPGAIVEQTLALLAARLEDMKVEVLVDQHGAPAEIVADAEQIGRVLKNVVTNALDAMEGSAERVLRVAVRREGERAVVEVRDTGRGFEPEELRRVFTPYFTTRAGKGGTGLGMAISRRIALEHGGSLRAEGAPGGGATITLTLPLSGPPRDNA